MQVGSVSSALSTTDYVLHVDIWIIVSGVRVIPANILIAKDTRGIIHSTTATMPNVKLKDFPIPLEYWVEEYDYSYRITVAMPCTDRDKGDPIKLFLYFTYDKDYYTEVEAVREALAETMLHEIDECLYVDGDRVFDPHDPNKLHD